jgi:hypothetical protein
MSTSEAQKVGPRSATGTTAVILGVYAGLLGVVHGAFAIGQGQTAPATLSINAIGPPCQADAVWHACLPAITLVPNFFITGVLAVIVGLLMLSWALAVVRQGKGGGILISLSFLLLLVGGGFVSAFVGIVGGTAVTRFQSSFTPLPSPIWRLGAALWPWTLLAFIGWSLGGWILGYFFNQLLLNFSGILFVVFDVGVPLLSVFGAIAVDERETAVVSP